MPDIVEPGQRVGFLDLLFYAYPEQRDRRSASIDQEQARVSLGNSEDFK